MKKEERKNVSNEEKEEPLGPGKPKKGHPSFKNAGGFYVDPKYKEGHALSYPALGEVLQNSDKTPARDELVKKFGEKKASKMIDEARASLGIPEKGLKGFIKRRLK